MESWTQVEDALSAASKDKKWLAGKLGIAKMQTIDHWANRGVPHKYRAEINAIFQVSTPNQALAPVLYAQAATNIRSSIQNLGEQIKTMSAGRKTAILALLAEYEKDPERITNEIEMLLGGTDNDSTTR